MKYSIRIMKDGKFHAYLSHLDRTAWCASQARKHVKEAKGLEHFQGCTFVLEKESNE